MLVVGPDWRIKAVSANAGMVGLGEAETWLGQSISDVLGGDAVHEVRNRMTWLNSERALAQDYGLRLGPDHKAYDLQVRLKGDDYVIEAEPAGEARLPDSIGLVGSMLDRIGGKDFREIADSGLRQLRALTGFNRLTCCDRNGDAVASSATGSAPSLDGEPLAGPVDFPRVIADCEAECAELLGQDTGGLARHLTFAAPQADEKLRLANIGATASMSLPIRIDGENVGMIHAHHRSAKRCGAERRAVTGMLADRIAARMTRHGWTP